jgi:cystathionine beta-lyase
MKKDTIITEAGRDPRSNHGFVNPPVYHASTILHETVADLEWSRGHRWEPGVYTYGRHGSPTHAALEEAMAALEGGWRGMCVGSGLGAINAVLLAFVSAGDHVLMVDTVYGPARRFCREFLGRFGVETTYFDPGIGAAITDLMRETTRVVFLESPGSLTFEVMDVPAVVKAAHAAGAVAILDNTWSGGYFFRPFDHGVDVSVQAATKYIVGHSDVMMGTITTNEEHVRLARHQETALTIARWLQTRPEVRRVMHPGLPEDPGHDIWKRDFSGSSGLFGAVLGDYSKDAITAMLDGMRLHSMGASWGGYESLIMPTNPAPLRTATTWDEGPTIRIHAGLEDPEDLIADLEEGFERLTAHG